VANYTMRADGTAANKGAAEDGDPAVQAECMSIATHNAETFSAGDVIMLADTGGDYRATLTTPSAGSSGNEITYEKYSGDTPILNGADLVATWGVHDGSIYSATLTTQPKQVFIDGNLGDRKTSIGACVAEYDWYWASNVLYLYAPGDPDTEYTTPGVEACARDYCISTSDGNDYIIFDGLTLRYSNRNGMGQASTDIPSNITVKNCITEWNWYNGISPQGHTSYNFSDWLIEDNIARYNGITGVGLMRCTGTNIIRRNTCYENGKYQSDQAIDAAFTFASGIKLFDVEAGSAPSGTEIYENVCYDNGRGDVDSNKGQGVGIWLDACGLTDSDDTHRNVVHHNLIYGNSGNGIFLEITSYSSIYSNVVYDNGTQHEGNWGPCQMEIDSRQSFHSDYNHIYNNTFVVGRIGIRLYSYFQTASTVSYNLVKNNICAGQSVRVIQCSDGGDNVAWGSGNVYENNCFGAQFGGFLQWGNLSQLHDTYDSWETAHGEAWVQIEEDPSFTDAGSDDYALAAGSPCIGAGINLGPPYDAALLPASSWPAAVVTGSQDDY